MVYWSNHESHSPGFTDDASPAIVGIAWPKSEHLGPPAFAPDGSIWAAFVNEGNGLAARLTPLPGE